MNDFVSKENFYSLFFRFANTIQTLSYCTYYTGICSDARKSFELLQNKILGNIYFTANSRIQFRIKGSYKDESEFALFAR